MRTVWKAPSMAAGLWASTALPGVDTGGGSFWRQAGAVLGATVISGALWGLALLASRLSRVVKAWLGQRGEITFTGSLGFPALTSWIPGSGSVVEVDVEVSGPAVTSLGRALVHLLRLLLALAVLPLQFWTTGWIASELGLGFAVTGVWAAVGGCVVVNLLYASLMFVVTFPHLSRARAAADLRYQQAQAAGLDAETARAEAREVYQRAMRGEVARRPA